MTNRVIAIDESGNTGPDLLNTDQPVFVLASTNLTEDECNELLSIVKSNQISEPKFKKLKKYKSNTPKIIDFLSHPLINEDRVKLSVFHKKFFAITKIIDLLVENVAYRTGFDLYKQGINIAMSNLFFFCIPTFCGEDKFCLFLDSFINMVKTGENREINNFFAVVDDLCNSTSSNQFKDVFIPIVASRSIIEEILDKDGVTELDPSIPALVCHLERWGSALKDSFKVLHDTSSVIHKAKEMLYQMMEPQGEIELIGYDIRKFEFPLRSEEIEFGDSKLKSMVQVTDILASATAYWASGVLKENNDELWTELDRLNLMQYSIISMWPELKTTPTELGTLDTSGSNPIDKMTEYLIKNS